MNGAIRLVIFTAFITCLLTPAGRVQADISVAEGVDTVVLNASSSVDARLTSYLTLEFDDPAPAKKIEAELENSFGPLDMRVSPRGLHVSLRLLSNAQPVAKHDPSDANSAKAFYPIFCDGSNSFIDSNGTFSIQRACGSRLVPWGWRMSAAVRSICVNYTVDESGLRWTKNGVQMQANSDHDNLGCGYQFHGTLNPVLKGSRVGYDDVFTFRHNVQGGGNATITIRGQLEFLGPA